MSSPTYIYPGVDPDENMGRRLNAIAIAFITLTFVTLVLRLISRIKTKIAIEADDWLVFIASVGLYCTNIIADAERKLTCGC